MPQVKLESGLPLGSNLIHQNEEEFASMRWPLDFCMQPESVGTQKKYWHHWQYRNSAGKRVEVLYSKTTTDSEALALKFLNESVLGFDMEWPWDSHKHTRLQQKVGLIQIACEDKIALFHIGLHTGRTAEDLISPSLRKIIESPSIIKTGVGIQNADYSRLERWFGLKPRGAFELSHLHNLVTHGAENPEMVTTKLRALATQVNVHLGRSLAKGAVRTSNWSKPIGQEQRNYAADDAYAGFMLYHCMQAKRLAMDPVPPAPRNASEYLPNKMARVQSIQLEASSRTTLTAYQFYERLGPTEDAVDNSIADAEDPESSEVVGFEQVQQDLFELSTPLAPIRDKSNALKARTRAQKTKSVATDEADYPQALFDLLVERRRLLAEAQNIPVYCIIHNSVLKSLARQQPKNQIAMLDIAGMGKQKGSKYGAEFMEIIEKYTPDASPSPAFTSYKKTFTPEVNPLSSSRSCPILSTVKFSPRRGTKRYGEVQCSDGQPSSQVPAQLHTSLSYSMAQTELDYKAIKNNSLAKDYDPDHSDDAFGALPTPIDSLLKRQRFRSPPLVKPVCPLGLEPETASPLSLKSQLFAKKLTAFSKRVASLSSTEVNTFVSGNTIAKIAAALPQTVEEAHRIQGIATFIQASTAINLDLLDFIFKNTR
ncbi:hypothetical protein BJ878DRAFT_481508 [Calycina marina]|uniref:HRDC domain-containing protein n=1 Tax=Calycina marina TaxID=1763456 RepID=A0A9P7Z0B7_9HELO|nr:hypothetical protein BJ878DRAFT_481508 [Calycina marina]